MESLKLGTVLEAARNKTQKMKSLKDLLIDSATHQFTQAGVYNEPMLTDEEARKSSLVTFEAAEASVFCKKMDNTKPSQIFRSMSLYSLAILLTDIEECGFNKAKLTLKEVLSLSNPSPRFLSETVEFGKKVTTWPYSKRNVIEMSQTWAFPIAVRDLDSLSKSLAHVEISDAPPSKAVEIAKSRTQQQSSNSMTALNYLLADVSNGKFGGYQEMVSKIEDAEDTASKALDRISELSKELKIAQSMPKPTLSKYVKGDGTIPSGTTFTENAQAIFNIQDPRLDVDVTCWRWDADNPYVPTIIPYFNFDVEMLSNFLWAIKHQRNCWLKGHTGTGKTTFVEQVNARLGKMCFRLSCDVGTENYHVIGSKDITVKDGKSVSTFTEAVLPNAMALPSQFLIDEADALRGDIAYLFQPVLEGQPLRINEDGGRLVYPDPYFCVAATANSGGSGDDTGLYAAAIKMQSTAQTNRYHMFFEVDYMSAADELEVVKAAVPNLPALQHDNLLTFLTDYRKAFLDGTISMPISPRNSITIAQYCADFDQVVGSGDAFRNAVKVNVTMRCTDMDKARVNELVERITKGPTLTEEGFEANPNEQPF